MRTAALHLDLVLFSVELGDEVLCQSFTLSALATPPYYGGNVSESLFKNGLCLPSGSSLTEDDLERVVKTVTSLL